MSRGMPPGMPLLRIFNESFWVVCFHFYQICSNSLVIFLCCSSTVFLCYVWFRWAHRSGTLYNEFPEGKSHCNYWKSFLISITLLFASLVFDSIPCMQKEGIPHMISLGPWKGLSAILFRVVVRKLNNVHFFSLNQLMNKSDKNKKQCNCAFQKETQ